MAGHARPVAPGPTCGVCEGPIARRDGEAPSDWRRRLYCGRLCYGVAMARRAQTRRLYVVRAHHADEPEGFPGATAATDADLPPVCAVCGGPWRTIPGGVACYLCGRDQYVVSALRATYR